MLTGTTELTITPPPVSEFIEPCLDPWLIAYSRPRQEHIAKTSLEREGFECWYPLRKIVSTRPLRTISSKTRHRRRFECVEKVEPVLRGYLFIRRLFGWFDLGRIYELSGCGGLCKFGQEDATVQDFHVELLRLAEADGRFNEYHTTVPITYRLSMKPDPRQWTGTSRLIGRVDRRNKSLQFREEFGRVLRFLEGATPQATQ